LDTSDQLDTDMRKWLAGEGWRQGSLLCIEKYKELLGFSSGYCPEADTLIIATQTCDLLHPSFSTEPEVEVLLT
jgi:hypothetical protein